MKNFFTLFSVAILLLHLSSPSTLADSGYVLPYPSFMPGSKLYAFYTMWEEWMGYWYFGNFSKISYNLKQADRYLIEAKTLFEYKQYLLALSALKNSDYYFDNIGKYILLAKKENKDVSQKIDLISMASAKHIEVLSTIKKQIPDSFEWKPEKEKSKILLLRNDLKNSEDLRKKYVK